MSIPEPCMCGDPACGICGPLMGYDWSEEEQQMLEDQQKKIRLINDIDILISHIAEHNAFDKQDLIQLLKRAKTWINNTPIGT